jgi:hypothetical protein
MAPRNSKKRGTSAKGRKGKALGERSVNVAAGKKPAKRDTREAPASREASDEAVVYVSRTAPLWILSSGNIMSGTHV